MYTEQTLTQKVLYLQTHPEAYRLRRELYEFCELTIYTYPVKVHVLTRDDAGELLILVYPRIENLLLNFTDQGIPFEVYMKRISYLQAVSFKKVRRKERRRFVCDMYPPEEIDYFTHNDCCRSITNNTEELTWETDTPIAQEIHDKVRTPGPFRNRILHLILLCGELLRAPHISFLAQYLAMDELVLAEMITHAIRLSEKRITISEKKKRIRDTHFSEKQFLEREYLFLNKIDTYSAGVKEVERKLQCTTHYWKTMKNQIARRPSNITHAVAGEITKTPKGTVDSGLQALYRYLNDRVDDSA
ncbi:MAG: hypothetical protein JXK93_09865 [Sphaerochaetaceae bacterium]|nr:hypothetical protein [Sphaerochaetaceae bacterium]